MRSNSPEISTWNQLQLLTQINSTESWTDSGAPTPLKAELKLHFQDSRRSQTHVALNLRQRRSRNNTGHLKASLRLLNPAGWSEEAASTVHFGYLRLTCKYKLETMVGLQWIKNPNWWPFGCILDDLLWILGQRPAETLLVSRMMAPKILTTVLCSNVPR